ncbi:RHS repeat domain-containing protein, partial [Pseudomonas viridiflava]
DAAANRLNFNTSRFDHVKDNRLKQWRDQEYTYDAWGNLIEKRSGLAKWQTFTYDCENRLVRAETMLNSQLDSTGTYQYDSLGRRIGKTSITDGKTEHKNFLWQGLRMLREEGPGQSSLYVYEPGSYAPLARVDQREGEAESTLYYFHTDQIGTPLEMTDIDGQIVWQATYKAWGSLEALTVNEVEQNLRFQGQYFDEETGLHYNTFRYYDPEVGRFITQDPIGLEGGFNLYQYVSNATRWVDPLGLSELLGLVTEAHGLLDPTAQKFKTTALGMTNDGKMFIASSDKTVPKVQREWAQTKGISVVNGPGHAEETIIKAGKGATNIDASRGVCLDCEHLMKEHGVSTDTHTTGKKSRKRLGGSTCSGL